MRYQGCQVRCNIKAWVLMQDPSTQTFSKVTIPNVPFASGPSWTVIFWVMANQSFEEPQPLFAFSATDPQSSEQSSWAANQVAFLGPILMMELLCVESLQPPE